MRKTNTDGDADVTPEPPNQHDCADWDDAYNNIGYIANAASYPDNWRRLAQEHRSQCQRARFDVPYGSGERERMDVFPALDPKQGTVVFVHGGYWMKFDKSYWSHLASGLTKSGFDVVIPSYPLAPDVSLPHIMHSIAKAIQTAAGLNTLPIHLMGHSAGGHLVSRLMCSDTRLEVTLFKRVQHVVSVSGLHDLRPLLFTRMKDPLHLSTDKANVLSPALHTPLPHIHFTAWVGGAERPEFIRQSQLIIDAWSVQKTEGCHLYVDTDAHHFSVIEGLTNPDSPLVRIFSESR